MLFKRSAELLICAALLGCLTVLDAAEVLLTKATCTSYDPEIATVSYCSVAIDHAGFTLDLHQPIENAKGHLQLFRKVGNIYKTHVVNTTFDACDFLKHQKNYFIRLMYRYVLPYTNLNHSCPLDNSIIVKNFQIRHETANYLPMPTGEYFFKSSWSTNEKLTFLAALNFKFTKSKN